MLQLTIADGAFAGAPQLLLVQETVPADDAHAVAMQEEEELNVGMPQLNPTDFTPQLVWLVITFILLLLLMWRLALPRVAAVLDAREQRIQSDLDRAERLKAEADAALAAYRKTMADARAEAQAAMREAVAAIAAEAGKREAAFAAQLAERGKAAEEGIAAAKRRALADLRGVGAEVAGSVLAKVAGITLPGAELKAAVDTALEERR